MTIEERELYYQRVRAAFVVQGYSLNEWCRENGTHIQNVRAAILGEAQRLHARYGTEEATKRLTQPAHRDKTTVAPLQIVSLDGRMLDLWTDWGDGKAVRPIMLALVDVASNVVLDWELAPSENAVATVRMIKRVCERFGIFDQLYTDNGSAFAGHLVAGGTEFRFRNGKSEGVQPMGVCKIMGIALRFALPKNAQAKIAERTFATLSRAIDDRPDFKDAHAGHAPGASPSASVTPVPVETLQAVLRREVHRHNSETGRRAQGARGRSYDQMFRDGLEGRIVRKPSARQLYLAGLTWKPVAVDRNGQVTVDGWIYGGPETQQTLLRHHGTGQRILLGRDPDDYSAPALAYDADGNRICEGIEPIRRGAYDSTDTARLAARNRKAARQAVKAADDANDYLVDAAYQDALSALDKAWTQDSEPEPPRKVSGARFGGPLRARAVETDTDLRVSADTYNRKVENLRRKAAQDAADR